MYAVIENAGQDNETIVHTGPWNDCHDFIEHAYDPEEWEALNLDIVNYSHGTLTTEF